MPLQKSGAVGSKTRLAIHGFEISDPEGLNGSPTVSTEVGIFPALKQPYIDRHTPEFQTLFFGNLLGKSLRWGWVIQPFIPPEIDLAVLLNKVAQYDERSFSGVGP